MISSSKSLSNKVVVITGATGGLGRTVSQKFADIGAKLVLVGTNLDRLDSLGDSLGIPAEQWLAVAANLVEKDAAEKLLDTVITKYGRVDILLHLVGGWMGGKPLAQVTDDDVGRMLDQHVWTTFFISQAFVPRLVKNKWGRIVIVSSPNADLPPANGLPYSVAKSGQESLILTLAEELKGSGVTANILRVRSINLDPVDDRNSSTKIRGWTTPEEITSAITYLCSDEAANVNGARIPLYGGP